MSELKRCPFCGGEAKIDKTITNTVSVECKVCHASSRIILCTEGDIEEKAIEEWNTRKPMENIVERLEEENYRKDGGELFLNHNLEDCIPMKRVYEIVKEEGGIV